MCFTFFFVVDQRLRRSARPAHLRASAQGIYTFTSIGLRHAPRQLSSARGDRGPAATNGQVDWTWFWLVPAAASAVVFVVRSSVRASATGQPAVVGHTAGRRAPPIRLQRSNPCSPSTDSASIGRVSYPRRPARGPLLQVQVGRRPRGRERPARHRPARSPTTSRRCSTPVADRPPHGRQPLVHPPDGRVRRRTSTARPGELTFRRYVRFGAGGAKLIWGEACAVTEDGRANPRQIVAERARRGTTSPRWSPTAAQAHREANGDDSDLLFGLQLTHSGRYSYRRPIIATHDPLLDPRPRTQRCTRRLPAHHRRRVEAARRTTTSRRRSWRPRSGSTSST